MALLHPHPRPGAWLGGKIAFHDDPGVGQVNMKDTQRVVRAVRSLDVVVYRYITRFASL